MKSYPIYICAHMYSLHQNTTLSEMKESEDIINDLQVLMSSMHSHLRKLGIKSIFHKKSLEDIDIIEGVSQSVDIKKTNMSITVSMCVSPKLESSPEIDLYRDGRLEINDDHIWFPAYVQINNVFTKGHRFNSFWTADLFIEDLMESLGTATESDYENGIIVQDRLVVFDESKFESNRVDIVY